MTIQEAYLRFVNKVNKNLTNDNISVDKGRFILTYNEVQNKYVEWLLNQSDDEKRSLQSLIVNEKDVKRVTSRESHQEFELPENFFSHIHLSAYASKGGCEDKIFTWEVKGENIDELYTDVDNEPSFDYRETFYTFGDNKVNIFRKNFDISKVLLTYYRFPKKVDIAGYIKIDNSNSEDIHPEFNDAIVDRILTICAKDFHLNADNLGRYQFDIAQTNSPI